MNDRDREAIGVLGLAITFVAIVGIIWSVFSVGCGVVRLRQDKIPRSSEHHR